MKISKPEDSAARQITFGVELETAIPADCGIHVGPRHHGRPVQSGLRPDGQTIIAPVFHRANWRAERDGSIRYPGGYQPCEFVSPILDGDEGVTRLREMVAFIRDIGGIVNDSCGCHVTIGIASVIGSEAPEVVAEFCRKLAHIAQHNAWAIYAQTGAGRHINSYSHQLSLEVEQWMRQLIHTGNPLQQSSLARQCGRGMVNFQKAFDGRLIEFRAFAGTLNEKKILHHLATALGLMRRAATVQTFGRFNRKATKKHARVSNAVQALRRMWRVLGWVDSVPGRDCALGLFGPLHAEFGLYRRTALEMAEKFEERFPAANL